MPSNATRAEAGQAGCGQCSPRAEPESALQQGCGALVSGWDGAWAHGGAASSAARGCYNGGAGGAAGCHGAAISAASSCRRAAVSAASSCRRAAISAAHSCSGRATNAADASSHGRARNNAARHPGGVGGGDEHVFRRAGRHLLLGAGPAALPSQRAICFCASGTVCCKFSSEGRLFPGGRMLQCWFSKFHFQSSPSQNYVAQRARISGQLMSITGQFVS